MLQKIEDLGLQPLDLNDSQYKEDGEDKEDEEYQDDKEDEEDDYWGEFYVVGSIAQVNLSIWVKE